MGHEDCSCFIYYYTVTHCFLRFASLFLSIFRVRCTLPKKAQTHEQGSGDFSEVYRQLRPARRVYSDQLAIQVESRREADKSREQNALQRKRERPLACATDDSTRLSSRFVARFHELAGMIFIFRPI